ncbi:MAG: MaoC family dehydratase [Minwuia sp.]|nr:MaoC family dehydratase [Minwuia sp.]
MLSELLTYDRIQIGTSLGAHETCIDAEALALWRSIYGDDVGGNQDIVPPDMISAIVMAAQLELTNPHPDGGLHAGQHYLLHHRPRVGDVLSTTSTPLSKEIRRDRRWVKMKTETRDQNDRLVYETTLTLIWAA